MVRTDRDADELQVYVQEHECKCLACGKPLVYGRSDRKFCDDRCKNRYHNLRVRNSRATHLRVMNILEKNYVILDSLLQNGIRQIPIPEICNLGFNPEYVTSIHRGRARTEYSCFDICYKRSDERLYSIRKMAAFCTDMPRRTRMSREED